MSNYNYNRDPKYNDPYRGAFLHDKRYPECRKSYTNRNRIMLMKGLKAAVEAGSITPEEYWKIIEEQKDSE